MNPLKLHLYDLSAARFHHNAMQPRRDFQSLLVLPLGWILNSPAMADVGGADARTDRLKVGSVEIVVPVPDGYVRSDDLNISPTNRILATYYPSAERVQLRASKARFSVEISRALEDVQCGPNTTRKFLSQTIGSMEKRVQTTARMAADSTEDGQIGDGTKLQIAPGGTVTLGIFHQTDKAVGSTDVHVPLRPSNPSSAERLLASGVLTAVNGRYLHFYASCHFDEAADREWAETSVLQWAKATVAANPVAPDVGLMGFLAGPWPRILVGVLVVGVVVFVIFLVRRANQRKRSAAHQ